MKEKVVFFGAGPYILPILEILNREFDLDLVVTTENNPDSVLLKYCKANKINVLTTTKLDIDSFKKLRDHNEIRLAVLASFGLFIPEEVLSLFPLGIINVHPSLLPKYRGATPVQQAILGGEKTTGVSIMKLDNELDHGPLLGQTEIDIEENDTGESLYKKSFELGARMLSEILPKIFSDIANEFHQDHEKATFTDRLSRESGYIDFDSPPPAEKIQRMIRAYHPWPGAWFRADLNGKVKIIKLLPNDKIQVEGKNVMQQSDFQNGYPEGKQILQKLSLISY